MIKHSAELPKDLQHPGGFVETVMNYITETAVCPQPFFALSAALVTAGTLYGRKFASTEGLRTNLFCMAVGFTSCGKDHAIKSIARIFDSCGASHLRLGQVTSDSAIEYALKRQKRFCFCIDEAGHYFGAMTEKGGAANNVAHTIKPALLELWSSANSVWMGKQRVPKDGKDTPPITVDCPHVCLFGTTQPQILFESLNRNDLRDGWLARNIFFISQVRPKPQIKAIVPVPSAIRAAVLTWKNENDEPVRLVSTTPEAQSTFNAFNDEIYAKMQQADASGDETNYLYGKAFENAQRIALILAISRNEVTPQIDAVDAIYATNLMRFLVGQLVRIVAENLHENVDEKYKKDLLRIISQSNLTGILKSDITRRTQYMRRNLRDEGLEDLVTSELVKIVPTTRSGGERYLLAKYIRA